MKVEELIDLYGDDILRLCIAYLGDRGLAEDAFQETFLKAWRALDSFRSESSEKTWLCRIAVNVCRDQLRSRYLRMWRKSQPVDELLNLSSPQEIDYTPVRKAVLSLPGMYREAVVLHYMQNLSTQEIADILHLPKNTVCSRLSRARKQLEKALKGEIAP